MAVAARKFNLRIATPDNVKYDEDAQMIIMRCITGDMGILADHEATSAILDYGVLRIINNDEERRMAVFGGIAQVGDNKVTILANDAQWPEDIDMAFVEAERDRMERRSRESQDDLAIQRDQVIMRRTLVQMEVSTFPLVSRTNRETDEEKK
ncbi:MAG: ATP synthase F1 subunit epsilon [Oscillospiraceae bacterium]|nr:ATP synthase F1 subunit epsilon [Oscillospiraceae bacterium]